MWTWGMEKEKNCGLEGNEITMVWIIMRNV
jgi:hypothetical protein